MANLLACVRSFLADSNRLRWFAFSSDSQEVQKEPQIFDYYSNSEILLSAFESSASFIKTMLLLKSNLPLSLAKETFICKKIIREHS